MQESERRAGCLARLSWLALIIAIVSGIEQMRTSSYLATMDGETINAFDYGCASVVDTIRDTAPCLTAANKSAIAMGKHKIYVPGGLYNFSSPVKGLTSGVQFVGDGWDEGFTLGTRFRRSQKDFIPFAYTGSTYRAGFIDIAFQDAEPSPSLQPGIAWSPTDYGPWITIADNIVGGSGFIQNVLLYGVTAFARLNNGGRNEIRGLYGQVFNYAIDVERAGDVSRIEDFHNWPLWSFNPNVYAYTIAHTTPIISRRNDNPDFINIFSYATMTLIWFDGNASGVTSKFHIANGDCDSCLYALYVTGNSTSGQIVNWTSQASPPNGIPGGMALKGSMGAYIVADGTSIQIANWSVIQTGLQIINITGINNTLRYVNGRFLNWGADGDVAEAISMKANGGNTIKGDDGSSGVGRHD